MQAPSNDEFQKLCINYVKKKKSRDLFEICLGISRNPSYISIFLETDNIIYCLNSSLTGNYCCICLCFYLTLLFLGGNPKLQLEALYCLINLGLGSEKDCKKLCTKTGTYLLTIGSNNNILQVNISLILFYY